MCHVNVWFFRMTSDLDAKIWPQEKKNMLAFCFPNLRKLGEKQATNVKYHVPKKYAAMYTCKISQTKKKNKEESS